MRLKIQFILTAVVLFMAACSSDDDQDINLGKDIAGTYKGYTIAEFQYTAVPMVTVDESVVLTSNENGTANIAFTSGQWGKFTISNALVSSKNDVYTFSGDGKTLMGMDPSSPKEYDCKVEGTISKDKKTVSIVFNVPSVMGGLKITFALGDASPNQIISGTYEGSLSLAVNGTPSGSEDNSKVTIKSQDNGKVQITLSGFGAGSMKLEDIVIADAEVGTKDGAYTVTGTVDTTSGAMKVTGSVEGSIKDGKANIIFSIKPGAMPMPIVATFVSK